MPLEAGGAQRRGCLIHYDALRLGALVALIHDGPAIAFDRTGDRLSVFIFFDGDIAAVRVFLFAIVDAASREFGECA